MRGSTARDRAWRIAAVAVAILTVVSTAGPGVAVADTTRGATVPAAAGTAASGAGGGAIDYRDVSVTPSPAVAGEPVTVAATIANRGNDSARYNATLQVDGEVVAFETGRLAAGERTRVAFDHRFGEAGNHTVAVGASAERTLSVDESGAATIRGVITPPGPLREEVRAFRNRTDRELPASAYVLHSRAGPYVLFADADLPAAAVVRVEGQLPGASVTERGRSAPVLVARSIRGVEEPERLAIDDPSIGITARADNPVAPGGSTTVTVDADGVNFLLVGVPAGWSGGEIRPRLETCGGGIAGTEGIRNGSCAAEVHVAFTDDSSADVAASLIVDSLTSDFGFFTGSVADLFLDPIENKLGDVLAPVFSRLFDLADVRQLDNAVWVSSPNLNLWGSDQRTSVRQSLRVGVPTDASEGTVSLPVVAADWDLSVEFETVDVTVEASEPEPEPEPSPPRVAVTPSLDRVSTNATATYDVVFRNAAGGVGTFDVNVTLGNRSVASVVNATVVAGGQLPTARIGADNATVRFRTVGADTADTGSVALARLTVRGDANGTTALELTGDRVFGNESGQRYDVTLSNATLLVGQRTPPDVTGNGRSATDTDGDGVHEDITGNGAFDILDVAALLDHLGDPAVENSVALFDANDDGTINILDVAALLAQT